jgi:hypothetical protein
MFKEWLMQENYQKYAPNKKFFTIASTWHDFKWTNPRPSNEELQFMAKIFERHGFPMKVTDSGEQWIVTSDADNVSNEIRDAWFTAFDEAVEKLDRYRDIVSNKKVFTDPIIGIRYYYGDKIQKILDYSWELRDKPDKIKSLFNSLDHHEQAVLVNNAGYFTYDGKLTPAGLNAVRKY